LTFDIGNVSVIGAMEWRALNSSMSSMAVGLPLGDPETDFWPRMIPARESVKTVNPVADIEIVARARG
jgi:hypothetical protein